LFFVTFKYATCQKDISRKVISGVITSISVILGYRYVHNIMAHFHVVNLFDCAYQCTSTTCCTAFNYRHISLSTTPGNCEIIWKRSDSDIELVERNSEYSFYELTEVTCICTSIQAAIFFLSIMDSLHVRHWILGAKGVYNTAKTKYYSTAKINLNYSDYFMATESLKLVQVPLVRCQSS
jgi:hypothetical protein